MFVVVRCASELYSITLYMKLARLVNRYCLSYGFSILMRDGSSVGGHDVVLWTRIARRERNLALRHCDDVSANDALYVFLDCQLHSHQICIPRYMLVDSVSINMCHC